MKANSRQLPPRRHAGTRLLAALVSAAAAIGIVSGGTPAKAQSDYPSREVTWVVGFPAGSFFDTTTRYFAERFSKEMGQKFNVENKPGGGSVIANAGVAQAKPDGYTLLNAASSTWNTFPFLNRNLPYNAEASFTLIHGMVTTPFVITVPADSPFQTMKELLDHARANPGKLKFGVVGLGTTSHLWGELLWQQAGVKLINVTYKGGGELNVDLLGGRLDASIDVPSSIMPHVQAGKVRPLVVAGSRKVAALPDLPTTAEIGYPNAEGGASVFLVAPAGTPQPVVDKLAAAASSVLADPATTEFFNDRGVLTLPLGGAEMEKFIDDSTKSMKTVIDSLGLKPQ